MDHEKTQQEAEAGIQSTFVQPITPGRTVLYRVSDTDVVAKSNGAKTGDLLPAIAVRVWGAECANLRIFCDGPHDEWRTSVTRGDQPGQWDWPAKV